MTAPADDAGFTSDNATRTCSSSSSSPIYYFGYGPIVNPVVRKRRGVKTITEQAALLPEYRLTFAYGGVVNAIKQRGYEVHGVLLAFESQEEWERFQEFDAGYDLDQVQVYPLANPDQPITAYAFLMDREFSDGDKVDGPLEKLPQERYLKLIAAGMRAYQIDDEYIEDHIMSVPYVPKTKPEDFKQFPQTRPVLPRISFEKYQERLCRNSSTADVYFVVGSKVVRLDPHDPSNPCSKWLRERAHGQPDVTLTLHQTVVDLDLPMVDDVKDITPLHIAWAENHLVEWLEQGGMSATAIFQLMDDKSSASTSNGPPSRLLRLVSWCCKRPAASGAALMSASSTAVLSNSTTSNATTSLSQSNRGIGRSSSNRSNRMLRNSSRRSAAAAAGNEDALLDDSPSGGSPNTVSISMELMRRAMPEDGGDTSADESSAED